MKRKRRTHSAEFKARVALEDLKGIKTINQIAWEEGVLPVQMSIWKKELQGRLPALFESGAQHRQNDEKAEHDCVWLERCLLHHILLKIRAIRVI